jgi:hypothetical protein
MSFSSTGIYSFIRAALSPLIGLSCGAMALAGAYLIGQGGLFMLWPPTLALFAVPLICPFLMIPAAMCGGLMQIFTARKQPLIAALMQAMSVCWLIVVMSFWGGMVFDYIAPALKSNGYAHIAALVFGIAGSIAPWAIFAHTDRDNIFFSGLVMMLAVGISVAAFTPYIFWTTAGIMAALTATQAVYEEKFLKKKSD